MTEENKTRTLRFEISDGAHKILTSEARRMRVMRDGFYQQIMERAAKRIEKDSAVKTKNS